MIDLQTNTPLDLLPTRKSEDVYEWLKQHPDIKIVTRDGSKAYKKAITEASPRIKRVGDRWHILHQLFEMAKKEVFSILPKQWTAESNTEEIEQPFKNKTTIKREKNEETRWQRIQKVQAMKQNSVSISAIARELNVSRGTVYSDLKISSKPSHRRSSPYDKYRKLIRI